MNRNEQEGDYTHSLGEISSHVVDIGSFQRNSRSDYHALTLVRVAEGKSWTEYVNYSPSANIYNVEQIHGVIIDENFTVDLVIDTLEKCKDLRHFRVTDKAKLIHLEDDDVDACGGRTYTQFSILQLFLYWKKQKQTIFPQQSLRGKIRLDFLRDFALVFKNPAKKGLALESALFVMRNLESVSLSNFSIHLWFPMKSTLDDFVSTLTVVVDFLLNHKNTLKSISIKLSEENQGRMQRFWYSMINSKLNKSRRSQEIIRDKISEMMAELTLNKLVLDLIQMNAFEPITAENNRKTHWIHFLEHLHSLQHLSLFLNTDHYRMFNARRVFYNIKDTLKVIRIWIYLEDPFDFAVLQKCEHLEELFFYNNLPRASREVPQIATALNLKRIPLNMKSIALMNLAFDRNDALEMLNRQKVLDTLVLMNLPIMLWNVGVDTECLKEIVTMRKLECCLITSVHSSCFTFCCTIFQMLSNCKKEDESPFIFGNCYPPKLNIIGDVTNRRYNWEKSLKHSDFYGYDCFYEKLWQHLVLICKTPQTPNKGTNGSGVGM